MGYRDPRRTFRGQDSRAGVSWKMAQARELMTSAGLGYKRSLLGNKESPWELAPPAWEILCWKAYSSVLGGPQVISAARNSTEVRRHSRGCPLLMFRMLRTLPCSLNFSAMASYEMPQSCLIPAWLTSCKPWVPLMTLVDNLWCKWHLVPVWFMLLSGLYFDSLFHLLY